eukprot:CAMPEP_0115188088 /NCGR_PEP_ID=MMETSP0270-20121206/10825_1 /TAXON_ID=71861 /ORGANISM="Scrippsiella trochoidea, Strain CCMP3099" /LENGTH=54 /DNA_ID=CAMNT_0002601249 /DNA_START=561 /DNA_END=722 /DNA_ORIENTATION=+
MTLADTAAGGRRRGGTATDGCGSRRAGAMSRAPRRGRAEVLAAGRTARPPPPPP